MQILEAQKVTFLFVKEYSILFFFFILGSSVSSNEIPQNWNANLNWNLTMAMSILKTNNAQKISKMTHRSQVFLWQQFLGSGSGILTLTAVLANEKKEESVEKQRMARRSASSSVILVKSIFVSFFWPISKI